MKFSSSATAGHRLPFVHSIYGGSASVEKLFSTSGNLAFFAESDRIRDKLLRAGVVLQDTPQSSLW